MVEGLSFVHNTLRGAGLRDQIRIGAAGKLVSAFDIARAMSLGADWCNSARGYMFSIGCIQAQACHTNHCPVGVATQDPQRQKALNVADKSQRVARFHANTLKALGEMAGAAGLHYPTGFLTLSLHDPQKRWPDDRRPRSEPLFANRFPIGYEWRRLRLPQPLEPRGRS